MLLQKAYNTTNRKNQLILPLTPELCKTYEKEAENALTGDSSCSLANKQFSCFGFELCDSDSSSCSKRMSLFSLLPHAFVAVKENKFCGCASLVSACPYAVYFPEVVFNPNDVLMHSLCVRHDERGNSIGKSIVSKCILDAASKDASLYLCVKKPHCDCEHLRNRQEKLLKMYSRYDFAKVAEGSTLHLMRYVGPKHGCTGSAA